MLKATTILTLMLLLCSCEIFGWDSSGGAVGGDPSPVENPRETIEAPTLYYADIPTGYPNMGSEAPTETAGGSQIQVFDLETQEPSAVISNENALKITKAACDQTATSILNINAQATETTIFWQNEALSMGSLSLSKDTVSDPPLQLITCIN